MIYRLVLEEIMIPEKLDTPYNKLKEENKDFKSQIKYHK